MADRRAELEKKKAQLAALKAMRTQRDGSVPPSIIPSSSAPDARLVVDDILKQVGISPDTSSPAKRTSLVISDGISVTQQVDREPRRVPKLTLVTLQAASIASKESVTYDKGTQTTTSGGSGSESNDHRHMLDYYEWDDEFQVLTYDDMLDEDGEGSLPSYGTPPHSIHANRSKNARNAGVQQSNQHSSTTNGELPIVGMVKPALTKQDTVECDAKVPDGKGKRKKIKELSEEEKIQIILSDSFRDFFDQAVRITQRAIDLLEPNDLFTNYSGYSNNLESDEKKSTKLSFNRVFCDDVWSKNRTVTCLDWSDQYPELLLASYSENKSCPNEPDGVCLVWNMKFKKKSPEYIFHCQSPVMSACFAKFNPNLIIGGTYSGQIVLWDNRSHKKTPVQRSPLSAAAHTHPIYCIQVIGTQNAHNLISISTDGKLCSWSLDMLSTPQESIELNQQKQSKPVNVTAMSFPPDDFNNFLIGSEDGIVYGASRHGNKQGVTELYEGHHAPVTRVHCNPITSPIDFSHLFLSSSFDWTVKLWSVKETKPLYSFEDNNDYVFDVKWSPVHPALFATVDITGRIDLWNLNNDTELPTASTVVEGNTALNKLVWSPSGNQLYAGDHEGKIWIYDVGEQLALPRSDEATQLIHTLTELKSNNLEVNDESDYGFSSMTNTMTSLTSLPSAVLR